MLLSFDTSSPRVSVALLEGEDVLAESVSSEPMRHGEQLAPLIEDALTEVGATRLDLTAIGVGVGPGPFTGLRVGLVSARTMGLMLDIPVYGLCSLDAMALEALDTGAVAGEFAVTNDARRKEVHLACYDADGVRLEGPVVGKPADLATDLPTVGEGADLYPESFPHRVGPTRPLAAWLGRALAGERAELYDPDPMYLRRPDAVEPGAPKPVS